MRSGLAGLERCGEGFGVFWLGAQPHSPRGLVGWILCREGAVVVA